MNRGGSSRAMRWCVVGVDASLVALEYVGGEMYGHALVVDAAQRVVRSGARTLIPWPLSSQLPDDTEWIHAAQVEDTQLAMPITLLVFRCKASGNDSDNFQRATKRARHERATSQSNRHAPEATRLLFFAMTGGSSGDWQLQWLGDATVNGDPSTQQIYSVNGPSVVAINTSTSTLSLLQRSITDEGDYAFAVTSANVAFPMSAKTELLSCQYMDDELTSTPHLLLQYANIEQPPPEDDVTMAEWRPPSQKQRQWATLSLCQHDSKDAIISSCLYLPSRSVHEGDINELEQITSCAFVPPPSTSSPKAPLACSSTTTPLLRSSVVSLIGMTNSTLRVVSNDVLLASYVLAGAARHIHVTSAHQCSGSAIVAAVSCGDIDRSFYVLSVDVWGDRHHVISPLQHFTFVGSMVKVPVDDALSHESRMLVLNDVTSLSSDYLTLSLRKSVVIGCTSETLGHATSSCHRLKHRTEHKTSKKRGSDRREEIENGGFQVIERVKIDKRERDFERHGHNTRNHSCASEQQLEMLTKSLQERLRVGAEHSDRLERVCNEKRKMIKRLNELLVGSYDNDPPSVVDSAAELVSVVTPDQSVNDRDTESSMTQTLRHASLPQAGTLTNARIVSFDRSQSLLHLMLDIQAHLDTPDDDERVYSTGVSVFAFELTNATEAVRSWSHVRYVSPLLPDEERSPRRLNVEVTIDISPIFRRLRQHLFRLGLWLRVEPVRTDTTSRDALSRLTSTCLIGQLEVDLEKVDGEHASSFPVPHDNHLRPQLDEYLLVSAGSSLPDSVVLARGLQASQLKVVRPLFAVLTTEPSVGGGAFHYHEDTGIVRLLRAVSNDVVTMVNPLSLSSVEVIHRFIRLLQFELDQLGTLENQLTTVDSGETHASSHRRSVLFTQRLTDLQAVRVLNEWQRRINFQSA